MSSQRAKERQLKTVRPLAFRPWFKGVWCAVTGVPLAVYEDEIKASVVEEVGPEKACQPKENPANRKAERNLLDKEMQEQDKVLEEQKTLRPGTLRLVEELRRKFSQLKLPPGYRDGLAV
jgi:hypothetical protein